MSSEEQEPKGPDLMAGIPASTIPDGGMLLGHANGKAVLVARRGNEIFAIGATCTHYSGPLAEGLMVGETVRCPWHHACFSVRTGEALRAPALTPVARWEFERRGDTIVVVREVKAPDGATLVPGTAGVAQSESGGARPERIVIVGAGPAGNAAAEMLRRRGFSGSITMLGADPSIPYDRPNLSKDFLAGSVQENWIPLRNADFYAEHEIELLTSARVASIDVGEKRVVLATGDTRPFDRLLLATGADPVTLKIPGSDSPHVHYLRTLADSHAIIAAAEKAKHVIVIGGSFIGLEAAAALRTRGLDVRVIAPEAAPLAKVFGAELAAYIKSLHEEHGVTFSLQRTVTEISADAVTLDDGEKVPADLVVIGIGVRPNVELAQRAGLTVDNGVVVNAQLETSVPGIYAAGDIARFPDPRSGERIRVEHFVVAERQGQTAARNMLGAGEPYDSVPFFWSAHYDQAVSYVGHAITWDETAIGGDVAGGDATVSYVRDGKTMAVATVGRDHASLEAERAMEVGDAAALKALTTH